MEVLYFFFLLVLLIIVVKYQRFLKEKERILKIKNCVCNDNNTLDDCIGMLWNADGSIDNIKLKIKHRYPEIQSCL